MRKFIFILLSIVALVSCHTGEQDGDVLLNKNIKVFRYDRLQFEATAMNSFSALQKMSLDCPRATKILIEDVLMLGTVDEPAINERLCEYYSDTILLRLMQDATEKFKDMTSLKRIYRRFSPFAGRDTFISHTGSLLANLSTQPVGSGGRQLAGLQY